MLYLKLYNKTVTISLSHRKFCGSVLLRGTFSSDRHFSKQQLLWKLGLYLYKQHFLYRLRKRHPLFRIIILYWPVKRNSTAFAIQLLKELASLESSENSFTALEIVHFVYQDIFSELQTTLSGWHSSWSISLTECEIDVYGGGGMQATFIHRMYGVNWLLKSLFDKIAVLGAALPWLVIALCSPAIGSRTLHSFYLPIEVLHHA